MKFVGVDLAWGEVASTGLCAVFSGKVVDSCRRRSLDDILEWLGPHVEGDCVVAIDAPLIVRNETGTRPCERAMSRCFGNRQAGPHPSNLSNPSFRGGGRAAELARRLGLDPDPTALPHGRGRWAIEVYPHAALVALFDLPLTLKYKAKKGRTLEGRRAAFQSCFSLMETLTTAEPGLDLLESHHWLSLKEEISGAKTGAALDRAEDEMDAYLCAYVAMLFWAHGTDRSRVVGDTETGYIVTPVTKELGGMLDALAVGCKSL